MTASPLRHLKRIRVVVSLALFVILTAGFLDLAHVFPSWFVSALPAIQLVPAILKGVMVGGWVWLSVGVLLLITLAFGRVYCSSVCPLGTLQDIANRAAQKRNRRRKFRYEKPPYVFHYGLLALCVLTAAAGTSVVLNLFEPYSNFGRIVANLVEPVVVAANNLVAGGLSSWSVYTLYDVAPRPLVWGPAAGSLVFLTVVALLAYRRGRYFCNSLCPAGALLGLVSRFTWFRIAIDRDHCNDCGSCERVCKASCIDSEAKHIDYAACIGCFNCIRSCPTGGVTFVSVALARRPAAPVDESRRVFLAGMAGTAAGAISDTLAADSTAYAATRRWPVCPPGSVSVARFKTTCTACHLCVSACPTQVLYPTWADYGLDGLLLPRMNYSASYCNYDCVACGEVCPTGAIAPLPAEAKKRIQLGTAVFVREDCVVFSKKQDCAACSEHCPTKAVDTAPFEGTLRLPRLDNELCVGCGACEYACPTTPRKAIFVKAHAVHAVAKPPVPVKQEKIFDSSQDFPF